MTIEDIGFTQGDFKIFDLQGQTIYHQSLNPNDTQQQFNITDLKNGFYVYEVRFWTRYCKKGKVIDCEVRAKKFLISLYYFELKSWYFYPFPHIKIWKNAHCNRGGCFTDSVTWRESIFLISHTIVIRNAVEGNAKKGMMQHITV